MCYKMTIKVSNRQTHCTVAYSKILQKDIHILPQSKQILKKRLLHIVHDIVLNDYRNEYPRYGK